MYPSPSPFLTRFAERTRLIAWLVLWSFLTTGTVPVLHAGTPQPIELRVAPGRVTHQFGIRANPPASPQTPLLPVMSEALVSDNTTTGGYTSLSTTWDLDQPFTLTDLTAGETLNFGALAGNPSGSEQREALWSASSGTPKQYFLLPTDRPTGHLYLAQGSGIWYPLTIAPSSYTGSDGIVFREAFSNFTSGQPFWLEDYLRNERSPTGKTNLLDVPWSAIPNPPLFSVNFYVEGANLGQTFHFHSRSKNGGVRTVAVQATQANNGVSFSTQDATGNWVQMPAGTAKVTGSVGPGMEFWLTRPGTQYVETPHYFAPAPGGTLYTYPALGLFPSSANSMQWITFTVRVNGGSYVVKHAGGNDAPIHLDFTGWLYSYDSSGNLIDSLEYATGGAWVDASREWHVYRSDGTSYGFSQTNLLNWNPVYTTPPQPVPNGTLELTIYGGRAYHQISIRQPDNAGNEVTTYSFYPYQWGYGNWSSESFWNGYTYVNIDVGGYEEFTEEWYEPASGVSSVIPMFRVYVPYISDRPFTLLDETTGEVASGNFNYWFEAAANWQLQISTSRSGHGLYIERLDGTSEKIHELQTQGDLSLSNDGGITFNSYYYFDATVPHWDFIPFRILDADTGERTGWSPNNEQLVQWISLPTITGVTGQLTNSNAVALSWPLEQASRDGAFLVERRVDSGANTGWFQIAQVPAALAAGSPPVLKYTDRLAVPGQSNHYRLRYSYGGQISDVSNVVAVTTNPLSIPIGSAPDEDNASSLPIKSPHPTVSEFRNPLKGQSATNIGGAPDGSWGGGNISGISGAYALHGGMMEPGAANAVYGDGMVLEENIDEHPIEHYLGEGTEGDNCFHSRYSAKLKIAVPAGVDSSVINVQERKNENGAWVTVPRGQLGEVIEGSTPATQRTYLVMDRPVAAGNRYFYRLQSGSGLSETKSAERYIDVHPMPGTIWADIQWAKNSTTNEWEERKWRFVYPQADGDPTGDRDVLDYLLVTVNRIADSADEFPDHAIQSVTHGSVTIGYQTKEEEEFATDWMASPGIMKDAPATRLVASCVLYGIDSRALSPYYSAGSTMLKSLRAGRVLQLYPADIGELAVAQVHLVSEHNYLPLCSAFKLTYNSSQIKLYSTRNGKFVPSGQLITVPQPGPEDPTALGYEFKVVPIAMGDGDEANIVLETYRTLPNSGTLSLTDSDTLHVRYSARHPDGSTSNAGRFPIDEATGARYRKVALNGRPLPDASPQDTGESDHADEETFVDALTLQPHHSTTDIWAPVPGSDLSLSIRRNLQTEIWNYAHGLQPHTRAYHAFGACWSSNLDAHLRIEIPLEGRGSIHTVDAYVTDSDGSVHKFMAVGSGMGAIPGQPLSFYPAPTGVHEHASHLTSLELTNQNTGVWTFRGAFGTQMRFELLGTTMVGSGGGGAPMLYVYARPTEVKDRLGNTLKYEYDNTDDLKRPIPKKIYLAADPTRAVQIKCDEANYVTDIWDLNGNHWTYLYYPNGTPSSVDTLANTRALREVRAPDGTTKAIYDYELVTEMDNRPRVVTRNDPIVPNFHCNLKTLTGGRGKTHTLEYGWDQSRYDWASYATEGNGSQQFGLPRVLTKVNLPDDIGFATFSQPSPATSITYAYQGDLFSTVEGPMGALVPTVSGVRHTRVTDAENHSVDFKFRDAEVIQQSGVFPINADGTLMVDSSQIGNGPRLVAYRRMEVKSSLFAQPEIFEFSPQAGMALRKLTDLNGHTTTYNYNNPGLARARTFGYQWVLADDGLFRALPTSYFLSYSRPTSETRAPKAGTAGPTATTTYAYLIRNEPGTPVPLHLLRRVTSPEGRITEYHFDSVGRRYREVAGKKTLPGAEGQDWNNVPDTTLSGEQLTKLAYTNPNYPGLVTTRAVLRHTNDPAWAQSLVTTYQHDSHGNVRSETTAGLSTWYTYDLAGNKLSVTNPQGHRTSFSYNSRNQLVEIGSPFDPATEGTLPPGATSPVRKVFTYDAAGNKETETNERGFTTTWVYDGLNRLIEEYRPSRYNVNNALEYAQTSRRYNKVGSLTWTRDPRGLETLLEYDGAQRLTFVTAGVNLALASQRKTIHDYTGPNSGPSIFSEFKPTTVTDPRGYQKILTYDSLYRTTHENAQYRRAGEEIGLPEAWASTSRVYDKDGNLQSETDDLTRTTSFEYDRLNRLRKKSFADQTFVTTDYTGTGLAWRTSDELRRTTFTEYDGLGRPVKVTTPPVPSEALLNPPPPVPIVTRTEYDLAGNVARKIDGLGNVWQFFYNPRQQKVAEVHPSVPVQGGTTVLQQPVLLWEYDKAGNVTATTDARGYTTSTRYTPFNRPDQVTAPWVRERQANGQWLWKQPVTTTVYDHNGNIEWVADPNNKVTVNGYDPFNQLTSTTDPNQIVTTYGYDKAGNRTRVTDGKQQTTQFAYDGFNRNTKVTYANADQQRFQYDGVNKIARIAGTGLKTNYTYDARHRLDKVRYGSTTGTVAYDYDYNPVGQLIRVSEPRRNALASQHLVEYEYDALGRVVEELSQGARHRYFYDAAGRQRGILFGRTNRRVDKSYDALGRLTGLTEQPATVTTPTDIQSTSFRYDLSGNAVWQKHPNNLETTRSYDGLGRVERSETKLLNNNSLKVRTENFYDLAGNLCWMEERRGSGSNVPERNVEMVYDPGYRLKIEVVRNTSGQVISTSTYGYDDAGNKISSTTPSDGAQTFEYNAANQLINHTAGAFTHTFEYDLNGNRTFEYNNLAYRYLNYDEENRLTHVGVVDGDVNSYTEHQSTYDYRGRRITMVDGSTPVRIVYSGGLSCREETGSTQSPTTRVEYIRGPDMGGGVGGLLYSLRPGANRRINHYNARGDVIAQTTASGAVAWAGNYEAFGKHVDGGSSLDRQRANTKEEDATGYLYEGFRYRDIVTGVFLTRDPAGFIDGPNLYAYVRQNPWSKFDPEGLAEAMSSERYNYLKSAVGAQMGPERVQTPMQPAMPSSIVGKAGYAAAALADGTLNAGVAIFGGPGKGAYEPNPVRRSLGLPLIGQKVSSQEYRQFQDSAEGLVTALTGRSPIRPQTQRQIVSGRIDELTGQIPANSRGRITMGYAILEDSNGNQIRVIATSEPRGYIRPGVEVRSNESVIAGNGHAEKDIVAFAAQHNLKIISVGATRPVCDNCAETIRPTGADIATRLKAEPRSTTTRSDPGSSARRVKEEQSTQ